MIRSAGQQHLGKRAVPSVQASGHPRRDARMVEVIEEDAETITVLDSQDERHRIWRTLGHQVTTDRRGPHWVVARAPPLDSDGIFGLTSGHRPRSSLWRGPGNPARSSAARATSSALRHRGHRAHGSRDRGAASTPGPARAGPRLVMTAADLDRVTTLSCASVFHPHVYWADGLEQVEEGKNTHGQ